MERRDERARRRLRRGVLLASGVALLCGVSLAGLLLSGVDTEWLGANLSALAEPDDATAQWDNPRGKHWQLRSAVPSETPAQTDAREGTRGACPEGMVEVKGELLLDRGGNATTDQITSLQSQQCTKWISKEYPARCADFDGEAWQKQAAELPRKPMHFCIDRFEYPNLYGQNPWIVVSFREAAVLCKEQGKRLCSETEWTLACEGNDGEPYPGNYRRAEADCVTDRTWRQFNSTAFARRDSETARKEVTRLYQADPSGSHERCRSSFGVYDMTGNVDEWTVSARSSGYRSVLKGGYWGPVRARCRPATRSHDESFIAYQQGFRCCADAPEAQAESEAPAESEAAVEPEAPVARTEAPEAPAAPAALEDVTGDALDEADEDEALSVLQQGNARGCGLRRP